MVLTNSQHGCSESTSPWNRMISCQNSHTKFYIDAV